ncbi:helix-turn-helix domain-containing protein [Endozoicomonas acroporae]|uniref:helix-turn-helix domain-containing protein n=1 Tax=Endozoicomonas TaxID=305899 RepID=UPI000C75F645|nr:MULTISPECIES: type II toxin-antitoxin system MqsA family antitoxin [Endozoicomonas]WBA83144.1 type II toxin-antitoxin system MqsA family antitoxin [Endozoicomonas sp. GU-1]WBA86068.1 type II toxin-antitoxin system MqsA family antitoxin [Endozoicomonas sp. GU-1]
MNERDIGQEILDGLNEIKAFKAGKGKLKTTVLSEPSPAKEIREKLQLSQSAFASFMGVSVRTIQDWEQGRRNPQGPAKALLRVVEQHPEVFENLR